MSNNHFIVDCIDVCSAQKLGNGQHVLFEANLTAAEQSIECYVACDEIGQST